MKILVSGASGLVGTALIPALKAEGHTVLKLVRGAAKQADEVQWDWEAGTIEIEKLEGIEGVVHLAGENIASGRWTASKKDKIRKSRVKGTRFLAEAVAKLATPPQVFVSASATGYYGDRGEERLTETDKSGLGFLSEVCLGWESGTDPAKAKGIRVVNLRFGIVLSKKGGALKQMLPPFQLGAGSDLGSGNQYFSWVALDDIVGAIIFALNTPALSGPANTVAPNPVRNKEFTRTLGKVLFRPTIAPPVPALALELLMGEMADALLLASAQVIPQKLLDAGYVFKFPQLESALRHLMKQK